MTDIINSLRGHFSIQAIDLNNNIIDEWSDNNMIMENARYTMSELFANLDTSTFINKFKIGTMGHIGDSIITPKGTDQGFVKERDRMFSESKTYTIDTNISTLRKNDVINVQGTTDYYVYLGNTVENYLLSNASLTNTSLFTHLDSEPYLYNIGFMLPGTNSLVNGTYVTNIVEDDTGSNSSVKVLQSASSVTFTIDVATNAANKQDVSTSIFTEASLWANDRIFAMKTFKAKVKDSTVLLRIVWTITF